MSYCCQATCLAHRWGVYLNIQARQWVHSSGWPCSGMTAVPFTPGDLE